MSNPPMVLLSWSDDKGRTWSNGLAMPLGAVGEYSTLVKWNRLGQSRGRVFELSWSADCFTALNGAYVNVVKAGS